MLFCLVGSSTNSTRLLLSRTSVNLVCSVEYSVLGFKLLVFQFHPDHYFGLSNRARASQ